MPPPEAECNGLLLVMLDEATVERILADVSDAATSHIAIDVDSMTVRSRSVVASFTLSERHRHMFLRRLDTIGATLARWDDINAFQQSHWRRGHPASVRAVSAGRLQGDRPRDAKGAHHPHEDGQPAVPVHRAIGRRHERRPFFFDTLKRKRAADCANEKGPTVACRAFQILVGRE